MLFLGKKAGRPRTGKADGASGHSTFGLLFNPDIGSGIKPIVEVVQVFVRLIAVLLASNGLFPSTHPALKGDLNNSLTFTYVIQTAWRNLSFTRANTPKVLFFFAVVGGLLFSAIGIITTVLLIFLGRAHAQAAPLPASGPFAPETADLAQAWITYLFYGAPLPDYVAQHGQFVPQSSFIQQALVTTLGFYSHVILLIAAFILFYHLVSMVIETAHSGEPMGERANKIWAPIRLVVAIGLLVPISGLNAGQHIVIRVAQLGSGLASQTWDTFIKSLAQENYRYVPPTTPEVSRIVEDLVLMQACQIDYNMYISQAAASLPNVTTTAVQLVTTNLPDQSVKYTYTNPLMSDQNICGSYTIPGLPALTDPNSFETQITVAIHNAHIATISSLLPQIQSVAQNIQYFVPTYGGTIPPNTAFMALVQNYQTMLHQNIDGSMASIFDNSLQRIADEWSSEGWVSAGSWFNTVAQAQAAIADAAADGLPITEEPEIGRIMQIHESLTDRVGSWFGLVSDKREPVSIYNNVMRDLMGFYIWLSPNGAPPEPQSASQANAAVAAATLAQQEYDAGAGYARDGGVGQGMFIDKIFWVIDWIAQGNGLWQPSGTDQSGLTATIGLQLQTANPFAELASIGHANLNTAYTLVDWLIYAEGGSALLSGFASMVPGIGGGILHLLGTLTSAAAIIGALVAFAFFAGGFLLAFFVPIIPFLRFFFNVLTWVIAVFEAVIAVPLIALAHLSPEGPGLPGPARSSYFFVFSIFLRPIMTVFGLIAGLLIFYIAISFLNKTYLIAIASSGAYAHGHATVARIVYSVLYAALAYICANNSFKLVSHLPDSAMHWAGGESHPATSIGEPEHAGGAVETTSAFLSDRLMHSSTQTSRKIAESFIHPVERIKSNREAARNEYQGRLREARQLAATEGMNPIAYVRNEENDPERQEKLTQLFGPGFNNEQIAEDMGG